MGEFSAPPQHYSVHDMPLFKGQWAFGVLTIIAVQPPVSLMHARHGSRADPNKKKKETWWRPPTPARRVTNSCRGSPAAVGGQPTAIGRAIPEGAVLNATEKTILSVPCAREDTGETSWSTCYHLAADLAAKFREAMNKINIQEQISTGGDR